MEKEIWHIYTWNINQLLKWKTNAIMKFVNNRMELGKFYWNKKINVIYIPYVDLGW